MRTSAATIGAAAAMANEMSSTVSAKACTRPLTASAAGGTSASIVAGTEPSSELSIGTQP